MTEPAPHDPAAVALELERLRGTVEVGFARVDGSLALLVQRSDQSDRQLADHETRIDTLERGRWPLPSLAAVTAIAGMLLSLWQLSTR
ncbi:hypothetical protein AR457_14885 [Streptomyces agglomeratus]|uniref:Uncharacterized protein n=1 Tax=Streptomyces agglomeratus TaxID=285458 RepID=A0A1E5P7Q0_9ACTN|nr:hypothetical protein [Streptomyces agglomeratus]OEJ25562.1 hypothetical protein AS594_14700 [Streptomyces agglomeratus]OEJ40400.1 hypothetical protein BGK70_21770 [Streptomyces agglomeratus]OEJ45222.1 hypothetical protein AR457_14885 [Streptomyces agglomeratus]OEJ52951.1 hypothetical protein BGK72_21410 [Streptomyces agglomeratus]OEJ60287.1 hypothetical protein BGM19_22115 [Streptomyces agglomeratus]